MLLKIMKATVAGQFGIPLQIEEVAVPRPGNHHALVKIATSGVCHTDLHATDGDWPVKPKLPLIPGHGTRKDMQEAAGFALGGKVKATVHTARLEEINSIFDHMNAGRIEERVVMTM